MPTYIYSHNPRSEGAAALSEAMGVRRIRHDNSRFQGRENKRVINWGSSTLPEQVERCQVLNRPDAVGRCSNKLRFFQHLQQTGGVSIPEFTTSFQTAMAWTQEKKTTVVARTILQGSGGEGIVLMHKDDLDSFVEAPLYTKYIPKQEEFRVHVFRDRVIDLQRKSLREDYLAEHGSDNINWKIRNLDNGFIYRRQDVNAPEDVRVQAIRAVQAIGLDFGAVDVIYNNNRESAFVLEINTAPGLQGTTIQSYAEALRETA